MFCRICGGEVEEGNRFCQRCGTPINPEPVPVPAPVPPAPPASDTPASAAPAPVKTKKKPNLIWLFPAISFTVILAVVAICVLAFGHIPERSLIAEYFACYEQEDAQGILDLMEEDYRQYLMDSWGMDDDEIAQLVENQMEMVEFTDYEIIGFCDYSREELDWYIEQMEDNDLDIDVQNVREVWIRVDFENSEIQGEMSGTVQRLLVQIDGRWYITSLLF